MLKSENVRSFTVERSLVGRQVGEAAELPCESNIKIRFDSGSGQFKLAICDGSRGTMTHVFAVTPVIKKLLESELNTLKFKKFDTPLSGACLKKTEGDSGVIELEGNGSQNELLVPFQSLLLNAYCKDPVVVSGVFDGSAMTRIIKIMQTAVGKI